MKEREVIDSRAHKLLALAVAALLALPAHAVEKSAPAPNLGAGLNVRVTNSGAGAFQALPSVAIPSIGDVAVPGSIQPSAVPQQAVAGQAISAVGAAIAPRIEAIAAPNVGAETAASSGEGIQAILQGGRAQEAVPTAQMSGVGAGGGSGLGAPTGGSMGGGAANVPPASAPKASAPKPVNTRAGYAWRRAMLASISTFWGMNFTLPTAGPRLAQSVLKEASTKRVVFSDIDDTLGEYNKVGAVLSEEMARSIVNVRKAGKLFVAITDRPDVPRPNSTQKGAFQSFEPIAPADREGIILGTNGGGRIYESVGGEWKLIYEEPKLEQEIVEKITEAAKVVEGELAANGTALKEGSHGPYGYSMILVAGTPESTVKKLAVRLEEEMRARGLEFEVEGRMAKDPTLPPYLTFSKINKTVAVKAIAKLKGIEFDEAVAVGDSMYKPVDKPRGRNAEKMRKLGERLSGGAMPLTGNATDANMEKGLPGMLTISVGGTADPRMANGYVLPGKGAPVTKQVLDAMASKPARGGPGIVATVALVALLAAAGVGGWGMMYKAFYDVMSGGYASASADPDQPYVPPFSLEDVFGGR